MSQAEPVLKWQDKYLAGIFFWLPQFILPNHLSLLRCFLALPIVHFMWQESYSEAGIIFILAAILDGADGSIARVRNQVTKSGAYIDPLADKVVNFATFLGFWTVKSDYYLILIAPILFLDFCLFIVATVKYGIQKKWFLSRKYEIIQIGANNFGKTKMVIQVIVLSFLLIFNPATSWQLHKIYMFLPHKLTLLHLAYPFLIACIILGGLSLYGHLQVIKKK